jgi:co-chaperonin GroES (HSP10)
MNFVPLGQRILVEDFSEKHDGKLLLPPTAKEKPTLMSQVVAISAEITNAKIKAGDTIYRSEFVGQLLNVDGKVYRIMNIIDVLGRLE